MKLQFGDVINTRPSHPLRWWNPKDWPSAAIQRYQRSLGYADPRDTHSMIYFDDDHILSVTWPKTVWDTWEEVQKRPYTIYRPQWTITDQIKNWMWMAAMELFGSPKYDGGQLVAILLNKWFGIPWESWKPMLFDWSPRWRVCSVGVRYILERPILYARALDLRDPYRITFRAWARDALRGKCNPMGLSQERTPPAAFTVCAELMKIPRGA